MANAVFIQNPSSIYRDEPGLRYNFPRRYLNMVRETIGDWVVFYEGKLGAAGYIGVQKVLDVVPDPATENWFYAIMDPPSLLQFERTVPRADPHDIAYEMSLRGKDGRPITGGANASAVRRLSAAEFASIVDAGLEALDGPDAMPRDANRAFAEDPVAFSYAPLALDRSDVLTLRKYRDPAFERMVKRAYGGKCAISGLSLRNGGGRPEVQAAHIRPVSDGGPDTVSNGLALSGTLHWMFDRGLISVAEDFRILVSHNKVPTETARRLIDPQQTLILPENSRDWPHPEYLRYHRENVFGAVA